MTTKAEQTITKPILVTGAAGRLGSVGFKIVELLKKKGYPVRAMVRTLDDRSEALAKLGAEVVQGDLNEINDVRSVVDGCSRIYFGMSVTPSYLEATLNVAAVAKHLGNLEVLVNMSQMTVSEMSVTATTSSKQQKLHWLSEQALNWSGLPVVHVRPTVFMEHFFFNEWAADSIKKKGEIRLPLGTGKTSPIATQDIARVVVEILTNPAPHLGKVYELTGPKTLDLTTLAQEYSKALNHTITSVDVPFDEWAKSENLTKLPEHVQNHILTMARLHRENRYDRLVFTVETLTGTKPISLQDWVKEHVNEFS